MDRYFKEGLLRSYHTAQEAARFDINDKKKLPEILNQPSKEYNIIALTAFSLDKKSTNESYS